MPKFKRVDGEMFYSFEGVFWVNIKRPEALNRWQEQQTTINN